MVNIKDLLSKERIAFIKASTKQEALEQVVELFEGAKEVTDIEKVRKAILDREKIISTGIGLGIAVPHAKIDAVTEFVMAIAIDKQGVDFESLDNEKVHIIVMILGPAHKHKEYLEILAKVILFLKNKKHRQDILNASTIDEIYELFKGAP